MTADVPAPAGQLPAPAGPLPAPAVLQAELDRKNSDIAYLTGFLDKREAFIREGMGVFATFHQRALDRQDEDRARFERDLAQRDAVIAHLTGEVAGRDIRITRLDGDRTARDHEIARLHQEVAARDALVAHGNAELAVRDQAIHTLRDEQARQQAATAEVQAAHRALLLSRSEGMPARIYRYKLRPLAAGAMRRVAAFFPG